MPIISRVEAKSRRGKLIYSAIIIVLLLSGTTMIYPFLIMASGTLRSEMDETKMDLIPDYMVDEKVLMQKFLETKHNQMVELLNRAHGRVNYSFSMAALPETLVAQQAEDLLSFLDQTNPPEYWQVLGASRGIRTTPEAVRELGKRLRSRYNNDLARLNREIGAAMISWDFRAFQPPDWISKRTDYQPNPIHEEFLLMSKKASWPQKRLVSVSGYFVETMLLTVYGGSDTKAYNQAHVVDIDSYDDYVLPRTVPGVDQPKLREEWLEYVLKELNASFISLDGVPEADYREFLKEEYGSINALNRNWDTTLEGFEAVRLPKNQWLSGSQRGDYLTFLTGQPVEKYVLVGPEYAWRDWLGQNYDALDALNRSHQAAYTAFDRVRLPVDQLEMQYVLSNKRSLRWTFAIRNFVNVYDALFIRGRAFLNTIIFCALSIVMALLINPMAAYAMSRFRLPGTYKFLLILMATMSFPPMVAMIPTFIMLRELSMLNTFWALVLPGVANGYMIFLLKGFFDSLPQELYDAALIDGSGEFRMFFQITMALSKPILAVVALGAFNSAYMMFLYALIVCPKQDMWLLSVWLFQYQSQVSMGGMFASVLVAAIPPLVIFIFAQNIIMRGIVVPVEK